MRSYRPPNMITMRAVVTIAGYFNTAYMWCCYWLLYPSNGTPRTLEATSQRWTMWILSLADLQWVSWSWRSSPPVAWSIIRCQKWWWRFACSQIARGKRSSSKIWSSSRRSNSQYWWLITVKMTRIRFIRTITISSRRINLYTITTVRQ